MVGEEPAGNWDGPDEVGRLGHFHVGSVGGEGYGANAESDDVRVLIGFGVEGDALCDVMVHAALHEAVVRMLHLRHVVIGSGGLVRGTGWGGKKKQEKKR